MSQAPAIGITQDAYGAEGTVRRLATIEACTQANVQCVPLPGEPDELAQVLPGLDGLIFENILPPVPVIAAAGSVRVVGRLAAGFENMPVRHLARAGIAYLNAANSFSGPVAQAALTLVLAVAGRLPERQRLMRQGANGWRQGAAMAGISLFDKTLGVLGPGAIGQEVFRLLAPFGMQRIATGSKIRPDLAKTHGFDYVEIDELCRQSDVLVLACPLTAETRGILDTHRIGMMKPEAILINVARGAVIDEQALTDALARGALAGAGLDTFTEEPTAPDNPLLSSDRVVASPHGLAVTNEGHRRAVNELIHGIKDVLAGRQAQNIVRL